MGRVIEGAAYTEPRWIRRKRHVHIDMRDKPSKAVGKEKKMRFSYVQGQQSLIGVRMQTVALFVNSETVGTKSGDR